AISVRADDDRQSAWSNLGQAFTRPHSVYYLHCLNAYTSNSFDEVNHILFVIGQTVSVELLPNSWVPRPLFLILIKNPFKRGAVTELVAPCLRGDADELRFCVYPNDPSLPIGTEQRLGRKPRLARPFVRCVNAL